MAENTGKYRCPIEGCGRFMESFATESGDMMLRCSRGSTAAEGIGHTLTLEVEGDSFSDKVLESLRVKE